MGTIEIILKILSDSVFSVTKTGTFLTYDGIFSALEDAKNQMYGELFSTVLANVKGRNEASGVIQIAVKIDRFASQRETAFTSIAAIPAVLDAAVGQVKQELLGEVLNYLKTL